jgi:hypothetical protein
MSPPDAPPFHPIWYITPDKSVAKVTCKVDLVAAVLGGIIAPSTQLRDDGSNLWTAARDNARVAPLLDSPKRTTRARRIFLVLSLALGALLLLPIIAAGFAGFRTILAFVFVGMILHESYKATIESIELSLARQILLYFGGVALAIAGFVACDALIELARLTLFPQLAPSSDWLTLALFVGLVLVFTALSELLWERFKPYRKDNRARAEAKVLPIKARAAQVLAKQARIHALLGFEKCGRLALPGGQYYEGKLNKGTREGHGAFVWTNGARYEGEWQKGDRHGHGVEILPDGTEIAGLWQNGKRTEEVAS